MRRANILFFLYNGIDTIILFTDGKPVGGRIAGKYNTTRLMKFFESLKISRKIQINTIGFDDEKKDAVGFLRDFAGSNSGKAKIYK